ncbi:MAG TPA: hypothetical protein VN521_09515 [Negativicutes bacterium]|nr:hypothetical protein [Negativicutes bacterium]
MVKPHNPENNPTARKANLSEGYGPNNPEPPQFKAGAARPPKKQP